MDSQSVLILIIVLAVIVMRVLPMLRSQSSDTPLQGNYGFFGGVVCPNCELPYGLTAGKINLGVGALSRCPHCGKWRIVRRASPDALAEAEKKLKGQSGEMEEKPQMSAEEKLKKELDASKYDE